MNDNFKKAYEFFISKTNSKINEEEFKEFLVNDLNKISEDSLENVYGGVKGKNYRFCFAYCFKYDFAERICRK